ncbi:hypothetical protein [Paenibacillus amylolyticus]|uniref:Peptidase M10 metallopeptidase domain-containing protein n=1 Tax=Paenibacillus amylolyticus TaxID=1451 RepID=A0A100VP05_PAEAM|nr:hypothetical protein [Paenibacillus amylolyticus]GAS83422.1 unknown protein [Paenibacillus amylolyticus]
MKIKKIKSWFHKPMLLTIPFMLLFPTVTNAQLTNGDAFYASNGFSSTTIAAIPWYNDSSIGGLGYTTHLSDARASWDAVNTANIGWSSQSSASAATLRFYAVNDANLGYYGIFKLYNSSGTEISSQLETPGVSWYKANIVIANANVNSSNASIKKLTRAETQDMILHEIGHAISLRHQPDTATSVMRKNDLTIYGAPTTLDKNNVGWKY